MDFVILFSCMHGTRQKVYFVLTILHFPPIQFKPDDFIVTFLFIQNPSTTIENTNC